MALVSPLVNGQYFSYADITFQVNGLLFAGHKSINYKDSLSREKVRGAARVPLGLSAGRYEATGDFEMYLDAANLMVTTMGPGWRQIPIVATISYGPNPGMNIPMVTDVIPGFYIGDYEASNSESDDPLSRKFTMHIPGQILWNGSPSIIETSTLQAVA